MTNSILFRLRASTLALRCRLLKHHATTPKAMMENTPTTTPMAMDVFLFRPPCRGPSDAGSSLVCNGPVSNQLCLAYSLHTVEETVVWCHQGPRDRYEALGLTLEAEESTGCGAWWMRKNGDLATADWTFEVFTRKDLISTWYCAVGRYGAGYGSPCHRYDVVFTDAVWVVSKRCSLPRGKGAART